VFEGVVSGVAGFGFWVETIAHKCEGLVPVSSLAEHDDFRLIEADYALVGRRSGRSFRMGDKVWIRVVAANLDKRQLDYEWAINGGKEEPIEALDKKVKIKKIKVKGLSSRATKKEKE
jgi:ribonuclease R